jgi:hypothetical protein
MMVTQIDALSRGVPKQLTEPMPWAARSPSGPSTCWPTSTDQGPVTDTDEAINGRLEHHRGSALGFCNLTDFVARCLLEARGLRP